MNDYLKAEEILVSLNTSPKCPWMPPTTSKLHLHEKWQMDRPTIKRPKSNNGIENTILHSYSGMMEKIPNSIIFDRANKEIIDIHVYLKSTFKLAFPLLQTYYAQSRFFCICKPQRAIFIKSNKALLFSLLCIVSICGVLSIGHASGYHLRDRGKDELWDDKVIDDSFRYATTILGLIKYSLMALNFVNLFYLTNKMNKNLRKSISFLDSMEDEKCKLRSAAYKRVIKLNNFLLIITLTSISTVVTEKVMQHTVELSVQNYTIGLENQFGWIHGLLVFMKLALNMMPCIEIVGTPLIFFCFVPSIQKSWSVLIEKAVQCFDFSHRQNQGESEPGRESE